MHTEIFFPFPSPRISGFVFVIKAVCVLLQNRFHDKDRTDIFFLVEGRRCEGSNFYFQFFLSTVFYFFVVKLLLSCPPRSHGCVKGYNTCNVCEPLGPLTFSVRIVTDDMYH